MSYLSDDLKNMSYSPTGEESPIDSEGELWSNGHELICDKTGIVIDGNHHVDESENEVETRCGEVVYRYQNSGKVKLVGGYISSYEWGDDSDAFKY